MSIQQWSENIIVCEMQDDPQFTDDMVAVLSMIQDKPDQNVVMGFDGVRHLNSSNIAKLLKLRKLLMTNGRKLRLCNVNTHVWGVLLVTGLEKVFEFADDVAMGLASVQLDDR